MSQFSLNLETELPKPTKPGIWGFVDLMAVALFFALFGSKFVVAPGLSLDLPRATLPRAEAASEYHVLTVSQTQGKEMVIFGGSILNLDGFARRIAVAPPQPGATLLLLADANVSAGVIGRICEIAQAAGYERVHWAMEERKTSAGGGPPL